MYELSILEMVLFAGLYSFERLMPARRFPISSSWFKHWCGLMFFASTWLAGLLLVWPLLPALFEPLSGQAYWLQVLLTYLVFSFVAYWYHRIRHSNRFLWRYVHYMHHAPAHMDTRVTFWRHPLEMVLDSLVILAVGKMMGVGADVVIGVLIVESMLEIFHHSNLNTPLRLRWVGYLVQLPEQHLIHHQRGLHRWNYATITLWDTLFGTVRVPAEWRDRVGLPEWNSTSKLLMYKY